MPRTPAEPIAAEPVASPVRPKKRRHRIRFWVGIGLILAGLGILGWLGWEFWGTTWQARQDQHRQVKLFEEGLPSDAEALLRIPRFGSDYVVPIYKGVTPDILARGIGHFPKSAAVGDIGNYALAGHRITHGQPFANLPQLRAGDEVDVETRTANYVYVLDTNAKDLVVPFTAGWVLDPDPKNPHGGPQAIQGPYERIITLTTCSELFHTDNRMIVFGHLVSATPK